MRHIIIHISGSPGAGKTTLGEELSKKYGDLIAVKDTDEFIQREQSEEISNARNEECARIWRKYVHAGITQFIRNNTNKIIVFVGILDIVVGKEPYYYEFDHVTKQFFLNVPLPELLKRYYTRFVQLAHWDEIARNEIKIPASDTYIEEAITQKESDVRRGYELATHEQILQYFDSLNLCNHCGKLASYISFCSERCRRHEKPQKIRFLRTGYFAGRISDWTLYSTGHLQNNLSNEELVKVIPTLKIKQIWAVVKKYTFMPMSPKYQSPGGDIGIDLYFADDLVLKREEVPELDDLFQELIK
jgi:shikimate kinase